jgi:tetratricopeptide (TPR) repeat protein
MLSRTACETIRNATRGHSQLRQRLFFYRHEVEQAQLKGVLKSQPMMELRFYHRLGIHSQPAAIPIYESLFNIDAANIWAYYQLVDYYGYQQGEWRRVRELAERAQVVNPADEHIKYDLGRCHFEAGNYEMSREYCEQALALNRDFDLAYEGLARIASARDDLDSYLDYMRKAVSLSPGSAVNHVNLGLGLCQANEQARAVEHFQTALKLWPDYIKDAGLRAVLNELRQAGALPEELTTQLGQVSLSATEY